MIALIKAIRELPEEKIVEIHERYYKVYSKIFKKRWAERKSPDDFVEPIIFDLHDLLAMIEHCDYHWGLKENNSELKCPCKCCCDACSIKDIPCSV